MRRRTTPGTPAADRPSRNCTTRGEFTGKSLEISILHHPAGLKAKRLVLAGGGKKDRFDASELRKLSGAVLRSLKSKGVRRHHSGAGQLFGADDFTAAAVEGAILADLETDRYKTDPKKNEKQVDTFSVLGGSQAASTAAASIAEAQNFTRDSGQRAFQRPHSSEARRSRAPDGRRVLAWSAKCSNRTACASSAWARCSASRKAAPNRPR